MPGGRPNTMLKIDPEMDKYDFLVIRPTTTLYDTDYANSLARGYFYE